MGSDAVSMNLNGRHPVKRVAINTPASAATHEIVAAVSGKKIVVLHAHFRAVTGQTITWVRGTSTAISGAMPFATSDLAYESGDPDNGILETGVGERLAMTVVAATAVVGHLTYCEV